VAWQAAMVAAISGLPIYSQSITANVINGRVPLKKKGRMSKARYLQFLNLYFYKSTCSIKKIDVTCIFIECRLKMIKFLFTLRIKFLYNLLDTFSLSKHNQKLSFPVKLTSIILLWNKYSSIYVYYKFL